MQRWEKKAVDQGSIMTYKAICDNCNGNGYLNITNSKVVTEPKQCWICESNGEIKNYDQAEVDTFIYDYYFNKRLQ